jgi:hypothetical protein
MNTVVRSSESSLKMIIYNDFTMPTSDELLKAIINLMNVNKRSQTRKK